MIENIIKLHNWNLPTVCPACGSELDINENHTRIQDHRIGEQIP